MNRSAYPISPGLRALALPLSLAMALGSRSTLAAEEPTAAHYEPVRIEFDFRGEDPARTKRLKPALEEAARRTLTADYGVPIAADSAYRLVFAVRWLDEPEKADRAVANYSTSVVLRKGDRALAEEIVPCMEMGEAELVRCALGGLTTVAPQIPETTVTPQDPPPHEPDDPPPDPLTPTEVRPMTALGGAGVALGAVGLAGLISGSVYLARGDEPQPLDESGRNDFTDFRPTGGALVGVGVGLLAAGVTMLAIDLARQANKRETQRAAARPQVGAAIGPRFRGLTLRYRF